MAPMSRLILLFVDTEKVKVNDCVPLSDLLVLNGSLEKRQIRVLKDHGCKTNVMSLDFFNKNKKILEWRGCQVEVRHSKSNSSKNSSVIVIGTTLKIGTHIYIDSIGRSLIVDRVFC